MSDQKELEQFNIESVYDEKISPLLNQIIAICNEHKMPMIASFAYESTARKRAPAVARLTLCLKGGILTSSQERYQ